MTNRLATDELQSVVWRWEGEAFGDTEAEELAGFSINLRFPGQYFDQETNLHYNLNRYYDPTIGRYITSDSIGLEGGINTYSYALQNPVTIFDPTGEGPVGFAVCTSITLAAFAGDLKSINDALTRANEALDQIKELEIERDDCDDDVRKAEINLEISELSRERSGLIVKSFAKGAGIGLLAVAAGATCGSLSPL